MAGVLARSLAGRQESKTFATKRGASIFLAQMKMATAARTYVSPHAGRMPFGAASPAAYGLSDSEQLILIEICRTLDTLAELDRTVRAEGPMTVGAAGQPVVHPAQTEARGQRVVLHRLLASLALPDVDGQTLRTAGQTRARTAATARWSPTLTPTRRTTG
jgi:hypothetical protein